MKKIFAGLAGILLILSTTPSRADAAYQRKVYVQVSAYAASHWPVYSAVKYTDQFTGTDMVWGKCRANYKCIRVYGSSSMPSSWTGVTRFTGSNVTIYLNPRYAHYSWTYRWIAVTHELGHANMIGLHNPSCYSVMYYSMYCPNGRLAGKYFTSADKRILGRYK